MTAWTETRLNEREPDLEKLIRERERNRCIACSHVGHKGVCGAENRVFAKGPCQCKGDVSADS